MRKSRFYPVLFRSAAVYNLVWGFLAVIQPNLIFEVFGLPALNYAFLMQGMGMFVAVFGVGYWMLANRLDTGYPLAVLGVLGKTLGPIGWAYTVFVGALPAETLLVIMLNDLIWLPFFIAYIRDVRLGLFTEPETALSRAEGA